MENGQQRSCVWRSRGDRGEGTWKDVADTSLFGVTFVLQRKLIAFLCARPQHRCITQRYHVFGLAPPQAYSPQTTSEHGCTVAPLSALYVQTVAGALSVKLVPRR